MSSTFIRALPRALLAPTHQAFLAQKRFSSLDGLRALSILAVIWHHTAPPALHGTALGGFGHHGVTLFFAISGFLITSLLVRESQRTGRIDLPAFYARRGLRIFPLYYAVLLLYVVLVAILERDTPYGRQFFENLKFFATYTSNLFVELDGRVIFYFAWSLATEEQFYLLWPPLLVLLRARRAIFLLGAVAAALALDELIGSRRLGVIPLAIVAASLLALALHEPRLYPYLSRPFTGYWASTAWLLALLWALLTPGMPSTAVHLATVGLVASCVLPPRHALTAFLDWGPVAFLGTISYGMYLLHMLCKNAVTKVLAAAGLPTETLLVFVVTTLAATFAAWLSYRHFESIFLNAKGRFTR